MGKKIFLTGGSGFVGGALCHELVAAGHHVTVLVRAGSQREGLPKGVDFAVGDLRQADSLAEALAPIEIILHVAGVVSARTEAEYMAGNAVGTANLLAAAKKSAKNLERFVLVSSLAAAGPSRPDRAREEGDSNAPVSAYGRSKLAGELELQKSGLPGVIIRPPAVYGPRDKGVYEFFKVVASGWHPLLGGGKNRRYSFVHVDDLVKGIMAAAFTPKITPIAPVVSRESLADFDRDQAKPEIFYISGDEEYGWNQTMQLLAEALAVKTKKVPLPVAALALAAIGGSAWGKISRKDTKLNWDKFQELKAPSWTCKNEKAKKILGFSPEWSLRDGFIQTAQWYREQGWL